MFVAPFGPTFSSKQAEGDVQLTRRVLTSLLRVYPAMKHLHKISPPSITFPMTKSFGQTAGEITQITVTTIDRPISIVHGHAKVSLSRRKITILRTARNRMRIFCNHISSLLSMPARSADKNFCHSAGVSVGYSNRALLLREMQCANDTTRHIDFTRYEISRYYYLSMLLTVTCCNSVSVTFCTLCTQLHIEIRRYHCIRPFCADANYTRDISR